MARAFLLVMLLLCGWQAAASPLPTPARLTEGPDSIEALVRLPEDLEAGRYVVQCEAEVHRKGRTRRVICYSAEAGQQALVKAVSKAGRQARFVPATRNGKAVDVYMLVMVKIDTTGREPLILAVPNNGVEAQRYGLLYSAPQRFNEFTWQTNFLAMDEGRVLLWQNLHIDEYGKVVEYTVTNPSGAPAFFVGRIEKQIERMQFMPGYFEGKPVPMFYTEPVFD